MAINRKLFTSRQVKKAPSLNSHSSTSTFVSWGDFLITSSKHQHYRGRPPMFMAEAPTLFLSFHFIIITIILAIVGTSNMGHDH